VGRVDELVSFRGAREALIEELVAVTGDD